VNNINVGHNGQDQYFGDDRWSEYRPELHHHENEPLNEFFLPADRGTNINHPTAMCAEVKHVVTEPIKTDTDPLVTSVVKSLFGDPPIYENYSWFHQENTDPLETSVVSSLIENQTPPNLSQGKGEPSNLYANQNGLVYDSDAAPALISESSESEDEEEEEFLLRTQLNTEDCEYAGCEVSSISQREDHCRVCCETMRTTVFALHLSSERQCNDVISQSWEPGK
jgi:hypothetical protein